MEPLSQEETARLLLEPNGPERLMERAEAAFDAAWELYLSGSASAGAFLVRCAKKDVFRARMANRLLFERARFFDALQSENPKLRKNAARLMGELQMAGSAEALLAALKKETQRFVRPSLLLALGKTGGEEAKAALAAYTVPAAENETEKKHFDEEQEALFTALSALAAPKRHAFDGLKKPYLLELRAPDRLSQMLSEELNELGFPDARAVNSESVRLTTSDVASVMKARCFTELLFVAAEDAGLAPKSIVFKAKGFLEELLAGAHGGEPPFGYRIEIRGQADDRAALIKETARLLNGETLVNAPGSYEAELRAEVKPNGGARLFVKLYTLPDERFSYRVGALPASMHPATAAAVLRFARAYLKENARVLDPFCGSGTFLIERERLSSCGALTGVDIAHEAVSVARQNAAAANSKAKFIVNDCLRFEANRRYDEVISNLPFGNRVGTHAQNERLYAGFLKLLPLWLRPGGVAVLYTMEFTLMKKLLKENPSLRLLKQERTEAGGLMPGIFLLENRSLQ